MRTLLEILSEAACGDHDPEVFFPGQWDHEGVARAKAVCARCPVRQECRDVADSFESLQYGHQYGVWGGESGPERRRRRLADRRAERRAALQSMTSRTTLGLLRPEQGSQGP